MLNAGVNAPAPKEREESVVSLDRARTTLSVWLPEDVPSWAVTRIEIVLLPTAKAKFPEFVPPSVVLKFPVLKRTCATADGCKVAQLADTEVVS